MTTRKIRVSRGKGKTKKEVKKELTELTASELNFVKYLLADELWRPKLAAKKAGYKYPAQAATHLLDRPHIARMLGREQRRRLERLELKADEVLHVLATGLFFNPLSLFKPGRNGKWVIQNLEDIPEEIGRCIESIDTKTVTHTDRDGNETTETYFELRMMSKTKLLEMAMKHCGVDGTQKVDVVHSGSIGLEHGISGLLEEVERTRASQIIDAEVIASKVEPQK